MLSNKLTLSTLYFIVLVVPVLTWVQGFNSQGGAYEWMRLFGLMAFTLMLLQLTIGAFMLKLRPIFGTKLLRVHIVQGMLAFAFALAHPIFYAWQFGINSVIVAPGYFVWGKVGLIIMIITVAAGLLRTAPFLAKNWRWVHRLNYLLVAVIYVHSWNVGSDVRVFPMVVLYWVAPAIWVASIYYKLRPVYNNAYGNR